MTPRQHLARLIVAVAIGAAIGTPAIDTAGALIPDCDADPPPTDPICGPPPTTTPPPPPPPGPIAREVVYHESDPTVRPAAEAYLAEVLDHVKPAIRAEFEGETVQLHVIPSDRKITDYAPWVRHRGDQVEDTNPGDAYEETRDWDDLRGAADNCATLEAAVGEERVTRVPSRITPNAALGHTLMHEVGHVVHCRFSEEQNALLDALHNAALTRPLDTIVGASEYTRTDREEYFANGTAAWFEVGQHESYNRAWLQANDPWMFALLGTIYETPPTVPRCLGVHATKVLRTPGTFTGAPGRDVVAGSSGRDIIAGAGSGDLLCGAGGNDEIHGGDGNDRVDGGTGADLLYGEGGSDYMVGRDGEDRYFGGDGNDFLSEGLYADGPADDYMDGGPGDDTMDGGAGNDTFRDSRGTDEMFGGDGNDEMDAVDITDPRLPTWTPPADHLDGMTGNNTCTADPIDVVYSCLGPGEG